MATLDDLIAQNTTGYMTNAFGSVMGAVSHYSFGQTAAAGEDFQAEQLRQNAGQAAAAGQHQAADIQLQSQMIASRALAVAGASGGGASDPGVVALMARNAQIGAYKQSVALYQGQERARTFGLEASAKRYQGQEIEFNSDQVAGAQLFKASSTLMSDKASSASLYQRYGQGAPQRAPWAPVGSSIPTDTDSWDFS